MKHFLTREWGFSRVLPRTNRTKGTGSSGRVLLWPFRRRPDSRFREGNMHCFDPYCHTATIEVNVPARVAFEYMADGMKHSVWAFGSTNRRAIGENMFAGVSMYSGNDVYVRLLPDAERLLVDFQVGHEPEKLLQRIMARIVPGPEVNRGSDTCLVSLVSWRAEGMSDARWKRLCVSHETQMFIIKRMIESGA